MFKIGQGFDLHRLVEGRKFILGGVNIEYSLGLLGHSDADVLCHAIIDALLGAIGESDIGTLFPDTDPKFKDIDSTILLKEVFEKVKSKDYKINNIDTTILAQEPKMKPYIPLIRENLSKLLNLDTENIAVKAKTMEGLGIIGTSEAVAVLANVLVEKP